MREYNVSLRIPADQLLTVIELLSDVATAVTIRPCELPSRVRGSPQIVTQRFHRRGKTLADEVVASVPLAGVTSEMVRKHFSAIGANPNSAGPAISRAINAGAIRRDGRILKRVEGFAGSIRGKTGEHVVQE